MGPLRPVCPDAASSAHHACSTWLQSMFLLDSDEMTENRVGKPHIAAADAWRGAPSEQLTVSAGQGEALERGATAGVAGISAALLMTELALTRIFSVTMYYHFAFLAISIALFGLSASGVAVYLLRRRLASL